jgi:hypothetical protein
MRVSGKIARWGVAILVAALAGPVVVAQGAPTPPPGALVVHVVAASGTASNFFQLQARPGATVRAGALQLQNPGRKPVTIRIDPVDGLTINTLGSTYQQPGTAATGSTGWTRLSLRQVTLAPKQSRQVPVVVTVPRSAAPGDYLSGVSVEALGQTRQIDPKKGLAIASIVRYAIGLELTLPGPRHPSIQFTGASLQREPSTLVFFLNARNRGNVILKGVHGTAQVTLGAKQVAAIPLGPGTFVSGTTIAYPVPASHQTPSPGTVYHVTAVLYYPGGVARLSTDVSFGLKQAVEQAKFGGPPVPHKRSAGQWVLFGLLGLGALIALGAIVMLLVRRRHAQGARPLSHEAALRLLERTLADPGEHPVSIMLLPTGPGAAEQAATIAAARPRLRARDSLGCLAADQLIVIMPAASEVVATALAADLAGHVAHHPTTATATEPTTAARLIQQASAHATLAPAT